MCSAAVSKCDQYVSALLRQYLCCMIQSYASGVYMRHAKFCTRCKIQTRSMCALCMTWTSLQAQEGEQEESRVHVLAPYTQNVNSIKRHVRTRIYFTSESHIHSLMNILRYEEHGGGSLLSDEARAKLDGTREFDYLTQIVFRLYEMKNVRSPQTYLDQACNRIHIFPMLPSSRRWFQR